MSVSFPKKPQHVLGGDCKELLKCEGLCTCQCSFVPEYIEEKSDHRFVVMMSSVFNKRPWPSQIIQFKGAPAPLRTFHFFPQFLDWQYAFGLISSNCIFAPVDGKRWTWLRAGEHCPCVFACRKFEMQLCSLWPFCSRYSWFLQGHGRFGCVYHSQEIQ